VSQGFRARLTRGDKENFKKENKDCVVWEKGIWKPLFIGIARRE
jgi:hypothetical protein